MRPTEALRRKPQRAAVLVALAIPFCAGANCRRSSLPPRPDGAAVVVSQEIPGADGDLKPVAEVEPNDTVATAQRLAVTAGAPAAVAAKIASAAKKDTDLFRIEVAAADGGAAPAPAPAGDGAAAVPAGPLRRSLRADVRPGAGLGLSLEALDDAGKVLVAAGGGQAGEVVSIPNLAVTPGVYYLRVRAGEGGGGDYRVVARLSPIEPGAEIEPNGSAALATELSPGGEAVGYLGWRRDQDWYRLPTEGLPEGSVLSVDLDAVPGVSASLQLYDAVARKLVEARGRKEERVALRSVRIPPGDAQVYLVVRTEGGSNGEVRYNLRPHAELPKAGGEAEPNDDPAHAQPVADGTALGYLSRGDVDVYRYSATGPVELDIEAAPPERVDLKLEVQREDGTRLARADAGRRREAEHLPNLYVGAPGSVLIRLSAGSTDGNPDEPYRMTVSSRPPEPGAEREPNDTIATPSPLSADGPGNGLLAPRGDVDFWKATATPDAEGAVTLTVTGVAGMTLGVRVLGDSGKELGRGKAVGDKPVTVRVVPGGEACCLIELREATGKASNPRDRYTLTLAK